MAQQRRAFQFRLPWLPVASAPRPTPRPAYRPFMFVARPEFRAVSQPSATTKPPSASAPPPESSSPPQTQPSRAESRSSSPSPATELVVASQPSSPSSVTDLLVTSQPTSPNETQSPVSWPSSEAFAQPTSPSKITKETPKPSLKSNETQSSVSDKENSATAVTRQLQQPAELQSKPDSRADAVDKAEVQQAKVSSQPSKESGNAAEEQKAPETADAISQPKSPSKIAEETPKPSPESDETQSSVSDKENSATAVTQQLQQPAELQSKQDIMADTTSGAEVQQPEIKLQPSKESGVGDAATGLTEDQKAPETAEVITHPVSPLEKAEENSAAAITQPLQQPAELQSKPDSRADAVDEAEDQQAKISSQPSKEMGIAAAATGLAEEQKAPEIKPQPSKEDQETAEPSENSGVFKINLDSKPLRESKPVEAMQKTRDRGHYEGKRIFKEVLSTNEQSIATFRPWKVQRDKIKPSGKEKILENSTTYGQQAKLIESQLRNRPMASDSHSIPTTSNEKHLPFQKEIKDTILKLVLKKAVGGSKPFVVARPVRVVTLAGENSGASMKLIPRGPDVSAEAKTDIEESSKVRKPGDIKTMEDGSAKVCANSNVQGINISVLLDSSVMERSPGVHLQFSQFSTQPVKSNHQAE